MSASPKAFSPTLYKGAEFDLAIEKLAFGGKAVGRVDGFVVFVDHAVPGQKVRVRITRKKSQFAEARVIQLLEQSPTYEPPFCPHFGVCGGCQWQDIAYAQQLHWKRLHVQECLRHLAGLPSQAVLPPVASPEQRHYRNKMEFAFAPRPWQPPIKQADQKYTYKTGCALGLHVGDSFDQIFNLDHCFLGSPLVPAIVQEVRSFCARSGLAAYNTHTQRGFWRFLVIREGKNTGQRLVHLITSDQGKPSVVEDLAALSMKVFPDITTLVHSVSRKKAQLAYGDSNRTLYGPGYIEEKIDSLRLRISAQDFLQINTRAAAGLYDGITRLGEFTGQETVWDLYCGAGGIALSLGPYVRRVVGFEIIETAVRSASFNSRLNGLDNCQFVAGDLKESIKKIRFSDPDGSCPDVVITDPPRLGMHPQVVQALSSLSPGRIIYVSCNPATLARDLALLQDQYEIISIQPFDLFPHTSHIECIASLKKRARAA